MSATMGWEGRLPLGVQAFLAFAEKRGGHGGGRHHGRGWPGGSQVGWQGGWPGGGPPWARGFGPWAHGFGGPGWQGGGPRRGRGDIRLAVLGLLDEEPMHGYQLIREIAQRSAGDWRASPGSVYPTLSQLEDEGLVRAEESAGRRVFQLTAKGRREAAERAEEFTALWQPVEGSDVDGMRELGGLVFQVGAAAMQVASAGTEDQRERAAELLERARRDLYKLLADEPGDAGDDPEQDR